jgi:cysteine desulfurase/selenocysteine lyase
VGNDDPEPIGLHQDNGLMPMTLSTQAAQKTIRTFPVDKIRKDFPLLDMNVHGKPLVYLDNAATTQKPKEVIDALHYYYINENANVHRGIHYLSELATQEYEAARKKVRLFLNAADDREIVFTRGVTESVNLVASTFGRTNVRQGDEVLISGLEHHSNIVPWQLLCEEKGAALRVIPINDDGDLMMEEVPHLLSERTKIVALGHVSNALGTVNPIRQIIAMAHERDIPVFIDGAQAAPHMKIDVRELDCDFYAFSSHKTFGPTGIGVLFGKARFFESMPPYQGGGDMIKSVTFEKTSFNDIPYKFEAGTPHIAGAVGLAAAIDYLSLLDWELLAEHERELLRYATDALGAIDGVHIIGNAREKVGVISFTLDGVHPHDIGSIVDREGVAIRTGHHCAQPIMQRFGISATARASFALYNTKKEIDVLVGAIGRVKEVFTRA